MDNLHIVIDTREQEPLAFSRFDAVRGTLQTGDYSVAGLEHLFAVERKSLDDLAASIGRERDRFERELHRLRGFRFKRLLIIGTEEDVASHCYRSKITSRSVLHSLHALEVRYDVPVVFVPSPEAGARLIERWAFWFSREIIKDAGATGKPAERCGII